LRIACDLMRRHGGGKQPEEIVPAVLPKPVTFEPNKEYLRNLLDTQIDLTTLGTGYVRDAHERFEQLQAAVHGGEDPPSERVIAEHRERFGDEYRIETEGPHPVKELQQQEGKR
jgi:hypothetical protein